MGQKAMDPTEALDRARQVLVLAHRERLSVLSLLTSLPDYSASAAELSASLGLPPEVVDDALDALAQAGLVHWQGGDPLPRAGWRPPICRPCTSSSNPPGCSFWG